MAKEILLFMDGTRNKPSDARLNKDSNVWKAYGLLARPYADANSPPIRGSGVGSSRGLAHTVVLPGMIAAYLRGVGTEGFDDLRAASEPRPHRFASDVPTLGRGKFVFHNPRWMARNMTESGLGWGVAERIVEGYRFVCSNYEDGDRVFLFGFSRGAYQVRSLVGFIHRVGTVFRAVSSGPDPNKLIRTAYAIYRDETLRGKSRLDRFLTEFRGGELPLSGASEPHQRISIHFVGIWDTVGALGGIGEPKPNERPSVAKYSKLLSIRSVKRMHSAFERLTTTSSAEFMPPNVLHGCHALAAHELRTPFEVMLWKPSEQGQTLKQVWFAGAHADVGGGYVDSSQSDVALNWMISEAMGTVNFCDEPKGVSEEIDWGTWGTVPRLHHEIHGWFSLCNPAPRGALAKADLLDPILLASCDLHESAFRRSLLLHLIQRDPSYEGFSEKVVQALRRIDCLVLQFQALKLGTASAGRGDMKDPSAVAAKRQGRFLEVEVAEWVVEHGMLRHSDYDHITLSVAIAILLIMRNDAPCERLVRWLTGRTRSLSTEQAEKFRYGGGNLRTLIGEFRLLPRIVPTARLDAAMRYLDALEREVSRRDARKSRNH